MTSSLRDHSFRIFYGPADNPLENFYIPALSTSLQAILNAIPRTRIKGKFVRSEAEALENMRLAFYDDLEVPVDEEPELPGAT